METRTRKNEMNEIDVFSFGKYLLRHLKWIIGSIFIGVLAAAIYVFIIAIPQYEATAQLYVRNSKDSIVNLSDLQIGTYLTSDYQLVFNTREVNNSVIEQLHLPYSIEELKSMFEVTNPANTRALFITVRSSNPEEAALLANTYADVAKQYISDIMQTDAPTVLSEAWKPEKPISPQKGFAFCLGVLFSLFICILVLFIRFSTDNMIITGDDVLKCTGLTPIAVIPLINKKSKKRKAGGREWLEWK